MLRNIAEAGFQATTTASPTISTRLTVLELRRALFTRDRGCRTGWRYLWQQLKCLSVAWCDGCEVATIEGQDYWGIESLSQRDD